MQKTINVISRKCRSYTDSDLPIAVIVEGGKGEQPDVITVIEVDHNTAVCHRLR